jgi:hypothetical protein
MGAGASDLQPFVVDALLAASSASVPSIWIQRALYMD